MAIIAVAVVRLPVAWGRLWCKWDLYLVLPSLLSMLISGPLLDPLASQALYENPLHITSLPFLSIYAQATFDMAALHFLDCV